jgi:alkylation response protein AidB-like acyl-CoA dehydrogenase
VGVKRSVIPSMADEQFHRVELDGVRVDGGDLLGEEGNGWPLLSHALAVERTGLDYSLKAEVWLDEAIAEVIAMPAGDAVLEEIGRFSAQVQASRSLAWQVLTGLDAGRIDENAAAVSKLYSSELARRIALWAPMRLGSEVLEAAYREAPGLTVSAGTSEMMLNIVASLALDGLEQEARAL